MLANNLETEFPDIVFDIFMTSIYPYFTFTSNNPNIKCCDPQCAFDIFNYYFNKCDMNLKKWYIISNIEAGSGHTFLSLSIKFENHLYEIVYIKMPFLDRLSNKKWFIQIVDITDQMRKNENSMNLIKYYRIKMTTD